MPMTKQDILNVDQGVRFDNMFTIKTKSDKIGLEAALEQLPNTKKCLVILSGGMDSTIILRIASKKYSNENVVALTFYYGQKQAIEIEKAKESTNLLNIQHKIIDASFLGDISQGFSSNVDKNMKTPTIKEILGNPSPSTYVPNRNMILLSIAAAYAETQGVETIICGLQVHDQYSYHDTTQAFVDSLNNTLCQNRKLKITIIAPFSTLSKTEELEILKEIDKNYELLNHTITCYNPNLLGESCGYCPSCSERIKAFLNIGVRDPILYSRKDIPWPK